ncbi:helix-turn-helix transcriptional regulator [Novosphingobium sp.]|uniref:helix-turn-helix transcriptional regulator n=1 Tax=Novosphingobium sp. TaxID=1874826 RepID=UPI0038BAF6F3
MGSRGILDDRLLLGLYGAIGPDGCWTGFLDQLRGALGVRSAVAQVLSVTPCELRQVWTRRDPESQRLASLHDSWANSPANPRFSRARPFPDHADLSISSDHRTPDYSDQDREVLRNGLARCGLGQAFWISLRLGRANRLSLIFHREPGDDRDIGAQELGLLEALAPHLDQATRLWSKLDEVTRRARLIERALDNSGRAMLACDRALHVVWANATARHLLDGHPTLRIRDGVLTAGHVRDREALRTLVSVPDEQAVHVLGETGHDCLHVRPLAPDRVDAGVGLPSDAVMLMLSGPARTAVYDEREIARLFGLTPAEAALAAAMARGETVADYATARGLAEGTARLHLKRVLAKTGTGRQAELVRQIGASVASVRETPRPVADDTRLLWSAR